MPNARPIGLALIVEGFLPQEIPGLLQKAALLWRIVAGILFGLAIGLVSSLLGVAGGELIIPTLKLWRIPTMSQCCIPISKESPVTLWQRLCPNDSAKGRPVGLITLKSSLTPAALEQLLQNAYGFCPLFRLPSAPIACSP